MSLSRAALALALAGVVSLGLSLLIQASFAQEQAPPSDSELGVGWAYRPASLDDLVQETAASALVEVEAVRPGEPLLIGADDPGLPA